MRVRAGMISAIGLSCACTAIAHVEPRTTEKTTLVLDAGCGLNHSTRQPCASSDVYAWRTSVSEHTEETRDRLILTKATKLYSEFIVAGHMVMGRSL
jgi:hypothetical protein